MMFNTIQYFMFLPIVVVGYYILPQKAKTLWLLLASYFFYMQWNAAYVLLILFSTVVTYVGGRVLYKLENNCQVAYSRYLCRGKKLCLSLYIIINLAVLGYYKYFFHVISWINQVLEPSGFSGLKIKEDILLPVGISFYTLQALGYLIDVYKKKIPAERNFLYYALFVSFFPQLVAGPIERTQNLIGQLKKNQRFDYENMRRGFLLILYGLFLKMVIADNAAVIVDALYKDTNKLPGVYVLVATVFFAFQIYCDFYGYSVIARGSALLLGIHLTDNFIAPYYSKSVKEFWRRWHVSLYSWFRDYIYIPLGGDRKGGLRREINLLAVFAVSGLWHGASLSFVFWGILNGIYQAMTNIRIGLCNRVFKRESKALSGLTFSRRLLRMAGTFWLVTFSWLFFRAGSMQNAWESIKNMSKLNNWNIVWDGSLMDLAGGNRALAMLLISIVVLMVVDYFKYKEIDMVGFILVQQFWFRYLVHAALFFTILIFGHYGEAYDARQFIYFQF